MEEEIKVGSKVYFEINAEYFNGFVQENTESAKMILMYDGTVFREIWMLNEYLTIEDPAVD